MALPFLHKFRSQFRFQTAEAATLNARSADWPLSLIGAHGPQILKFEILGLGEPAPKKPGIFIYTRRTREREWQALYIGESANLHNRLAFNEIAADALLSGATDIHILLVGADAAARRDICERLVFTNRPPLNEELAAKPVIRPAAASKPQSPRRQSSAA